MILSQYSLGIGDRFGRQGRAQLAALAQAETRGLEITPVWNKSNREHQITGTHPDSVRAEADAAVQALRWRGSYFVDADHITRKTVDPFIAGSDFFTIDVADFVGAAAPEKDIQDFAQRYGRYATGRATPGTDGALAASPGDIAAIARKYLRAVQEAGAIFRHIKVAKGHDRFIVEISVDEIDTPQTPADLFFILAAIAEEKIPAQTIAPKFVGRFNKGIDYVGNVAQFERQFTDIITTIAFAIQEFGLPADLKLSVHSGSDKFSIYGPIARALRAHGAGLHLKTAGTTWLEEVAGLALAGGESLRLVQEIYARAYERIDELCAPYAPVIDIDRPRLPKPEAVRAWSSSAYVAALRHDQENPTYNLHFRQLLHVAFRVAAEVGAEYLQALDANAEVIGRLVTQNLLEKHILRVFARQ